VLILFIILGIYLLLQFLLLLDLLTHQDQVTNELPNPLVKVTIMVAARNEEENILRCMQALEQLDYPKSHLQILLGNDQSTDATEKIIQNFIADKPHFQLVNIRENLGVAQGKANVLAHLAQAADGAFWLVTDADIEVPARWVQAMCSTQQLSNSTNKSVGIVTGFTLVQGTTLFAKMQAIDWVYALGLIKVWSDRGIAVTAMGNNLGINPEAYQATGGYEHIPFSITEDFALFQAIVGQGYHFRNLIHPEVMAFSQPIKTVKGWLHQRKRWMNGALQAPWFLTLFFTLHSSFWPLITMLAFWHPWWALVLGGAKLGVQSIFMRTLFRRIGRLSLFKYLGLFELYHLVFTWMMMVFYFWPTKVIWKGRKY